MKLLKSIVIIIAISCLFGCVKSTFTESIEIDAPVSIVFDVITDYENYDELIPDLHDSISIISENKKGLGVAWKNTGTFKGYTVTSTWTVTEFEQNRIVKLEDLEKKYAIATLYTESIDKNKTKYSKEIKSMMYKPYEDDLFEIYKNEMKIIKEESERIFQSKIDN